MTIVKNFEKRAICTFKFIAVVVSHLLVFNAPASNAIIDSLEIVLSNAKEDTAQIIVLNELAWQYKNHDIDSAFLKAEKALELSVKINFDKGTSAAYNTLGVLYGYTSDHNNALENYLSSLEIRKKLKDKKGIAASLNNIGMAYANMHDHITAINYYQKSLEIEKKLNNKKGVAQSFNNIAITYYGIGKYDETIKYLYCALKIYEEIKDTNLLATTLNNMGIIYKLEENWEKALSIFFEALDLAITQNNKRTIGQSYRNIGVSYENLNKHQDALNYYQKALEINIELKDKSSIAYGYNNIGSSHTNLGNYKKAAENYLLALNSLTELEDIHGRALVLNNLGHSYYKLKGYKQAITYLEKAKVIAEKTNDFHVLKLCYKTFSETYTELNNFDLALNYYKLFGSVKDSLFDEQRAKITAKLETQYETEKKEQKIALQNEQLARQNAEISKKTTQRNSLIGALLAMILLGSGIIYLVRLKRGAEKIRLEKQLSDLEQKAAQLQMNPHFIFNALNSINAYVGDNDVINAKKYLSKFAKLMRITLENSQRTIVPIEDEIEALTSYLELEQLRFEDKFKYQVHISPEINSENMGIPPLLIQPFVENSIIHGIQPLKDMGEINIHLKLVNGELLFTIEDNGIGINESLKLKQDELAIHNSVGMIVTKERLEIYNKRNNRSSKVHFIDLKSEKGKSGTKIEFNVPVNSV